MTAITPSSTEKNQKFKRITNLIIKNNFDLKHASPEFCIRLLERPNEKFLSKLHKKIFVSTRQWINEFIYMRGLFALLKCIEKVFKKAALNSIFISILLSKCLNCIKELLNSK